MGLLLPKLDKECTKKGEKKIALQYLMNIDTKVHKKISKSQATL